MNEGVGSTSILVIMMVFLTVVSAYMAYNVNYTKAFRLKNKIVATYDRYDGKCGVGTPCEAEIQEYADKIGYPRRTNLGCDNSDIKPARVDGSDPKYYYCEYKIKLDPASSQAYTEENNEKYYYHIVVRIDIQIPIVQNVFALQALTVTGDTKVYTKKD